MRIVARHYKSHALVEVEIDAGHIAQVSPALNVPETAYPWVAPAFFDVQMNGYAGQEFSSLELTPQKVADIAHRQYAFGVVRFCPTLTTQSFAVFEHAVRAIASACTEWPDVDRLIAGIHLEGPYLSAEDGPRGAHPAEHCKPPDWNEFARLQAIAGGRIAMVTLSPEYEEAPEFIRRATENGVVIALGHTGANSAQIRAAVDAGARLSTHLGNGAHRVLRRHPNYLWDQLAEDRLWASLIVDGFHLPAEVVQTMVRAKTPERLLLVSDLSGLAGLPPGRYVSSGCELEVLPEGRLVIAGQDQLLAGAAQPIGTGVVNVMRFAGLDLATAIDLASNQPARLLGRKPNALAAGDVADLVLFDLDESATLAADALRVRATLVEGALAHGKLP